MTLHKSYCLVAIVIMLGATACRAANSPPISETAPSAEPPTTEPTQGPPTPTEEPAPEASLTQAELTLEDFMRQVAGAWDPSTRDVATIQQAMADPIFVGGPDGLPVYGPFSPADAISQLEADGVLGASPDLPDDWYPTYDSIAIEITFGAELIAAYPDVEKFVWMRESDNGQFDVLAGIGQRDDGSYRLITVVLIPVVSYTVDPEVLQDLDLYTRTFIEAVSEGEALQGFVPETGVQVTGPNGDGLFLASGGEVIAYLYGTWGGGGTFGQTMSASVDASETAALMGNPADSFPQGQQFIILDRPADLSNVVAVIQGGPDQGGYVWTHIFEP